MSKTLTNDDLQWDSRPFSLTLAGCLAVAGMPLQAEQVAEVLPKTTAEIMSDPNRVPAPASCLVCQLANIYGCPSCRDERCPHPLPDYDADHSLIAADHSDQDALDAYCREELERIDAAPTREAFHITDANSANWYLKQIANIEAEKARITAQHEKMVANLDNDVKCLKFLYEGELQEFVRAELAKKGNRKKTLHLLQASCSFRLVPASVKVADPLAALEYARASGLPCIVTQERVDAEEYKKLAAGTLLPGMERTEERETFKTTFGDK